MLGHPPLDDVGDTHRGDGDDGRGVTHRGDGDDVGDTHRVEARIANDCLAELSVTDNTVTLAGLLERMAELR